MQRSRLIGLTLIALVLPIILAFPRSSFGQGGVPTTPTASMCKALHVVFVVDQSGSMFGFTDDDGDYHDPTDPDKLRFAGPQNFVELLANARWQNYADSEILVSAIYFGDEPETHMAWQPIMPDSATDEQSVIQGLAQFFASTNSSLGNTLPRRALESASSLFAGLQPSQDGCPRRVIILITDGRPADGTPSFNLTRYFSEMQGFARANLGPPDYQVYVIGVDVNNEYFDDLRNQWEAVAGDPSRVKKANTPAEMSTALTLIASDLLFSLEGTGGGQLFSCVDGGTSFMVPPYVQQMTIQITKPEPENPSYHLDVLDPGGQDAVRLGNAVLSGFDQPIEKLVISTPQPGFWQMQTMLPQEFQNTCLINYIAFQAVERVTQPRDGVHVPQYTAVDVEFQIVKTDGSPLPDYTDPNYDLTMDVTLGAPNGQGQLLTLGADPGQTYRGRTVILYPGTNQLQVKASSYNPDGSRFLLFQTDDNPSGVKAISTIEVEAVGLALVTPPPAVHQQYQTFPFAITLGTATQIPVELELPVRIRVSLQKDSGQPTPLNVAEANGVYTVDVQTDEAGTFKLVYQAEIDTATGTDILGPEEIGFTVSKIERLTAQFTSPTDMIATTLLGPWRPGKGIDVAVQLTDVNGQPLSPSDVIDGDPTQIFRLVAQDGNNNDVSAQLELVQGDRAGLFRARSNTLGSGEYRIRIEPIGQPKDGYAWFGGPWEQTVRGTLDPRFYAVVAGLGATAVALIALIAWFISLLNNPLSGRLVVYEMVTDTDGRTRQKQQWVGTLPRRLNTTTFRRVKVGKGQMIQKLKVRSMKAKSDAAKIEIRMKGKKKQSATLEKGGAAHALGAGLYLAKDPVPRREAGGPELKDTLK